MLPPILSHSHTLTFSYSCILVLSHPTTLTLSHYEVLAFPHSRTQIHLLRTQTQANLCCGGGGRGLPPQSLRTATAATAATNTAVATATNIATMACLRVRLCMWYAVVAVCVECMYVWYAVGWYGVVWFDLCMSHVCVCVVLESHSCRIRPIFVFYLCRSRVVSVSYLCR